MLRRKCICIFIIVAACLCSTRAFPESPISTSYIELLNPRNIYEDGACWTQFVIPIDLNNDDRKDLIVNYWCGAEVAGSQNSAPSPDAVMTYISNADGSFTFSNQSIFGSEHISLGGAQRNYTLGDFNNDGIEDVAYAMNYEDGRTTFNIEDIFAQQTIISSTSAGFEIVRLGEATWGHSITSATNSLGYDDVIFEGFSPDYQPNKGFQAYRYEEGRWEELPADYPKGLNGLSTGAKKPKDGQQTKYVYSTNNLGGIDFFRRFDTGWVQQTAGNIEIIADNIKWMMWSNDLAKGRLSSLDGQYYVNLGITDTAILETDDDERFYIIGNFAGRLIGDSYDVEKTYYENEYPLINILSFFEVVNGTISKIPSPIIDQPLNDFYNFFFTHDVNNDGLEDITVSYQSGNIGAGNFNVKYDGGAPRIYIQQPNGKFIKYDTNEFPKAVEGGTQMGIYKDINSDKISDLILYNTDSSIPIRIYYGLKNIERSVAYQNLFPTEILQIPQQSLSKIIRTDGTKTDSTISIGASSDGGETTNTNFTVDDEVTLTAKVYPDSDDVGEEGELYVVMRSTIDGKKTFSALNEDGNWEPWNASLKILPAAKYIESLEEVEDVLVYSGTITAGDRLFYVGYSLFTEDGKPVITTSLSPYKITVSE